jgi:DNA polymerase elongation subunit (family B)
MKELIFGNDNRENIVSIEVHDGYVEVFTEDESGVHSEFIDGNRYWLVAPHKYHNDFQRLKGNLYYNYLMEFETKQDYYIARKRLRGKDFFGISNSKESVMIYYGLTHFKGMTVDQPSILSFDIESTTLGLNSNSKVLLISNTYRKNGKVTKKLFAYDDYECEADFFDAWCDWVREVNPSIFIGHNIYSFDIPYLDYCAQRAGTSLKLGRDESDVQFSRYESKFRKDGSQFYHYKKFQIYGREVVDTLFLSIKYDIVKRKYENYKLKSIIKEEGLEKENRVHYDASLIRDNYKDPIEWKKIKEYCIDDSDDSLALYDLMISAYFYLSQSIPKSFQEIMVSASGSQINTLLIRSYLQKGHSLPKTSEAVEYEGGISRGNHGLFKDVFKIDVASLYPSIMLEYKVYDKRKDPYEHFLKMVDYFTKERLKNKKLGKETKKRYYKDLEQAQKIIINSAYGLLGATGLLFNSPTNAAFVTRKGRETLLKSIEWCEKKNFNLVNCDTDSISFSNGKFISEEKRKELLADLNTLYPEKIRFEDDGYYDIFLVVKAKNYALKEKGKPIKIKGSSLKASTKEKALQEIIKRIIYSFMDEETKTIKELYVEYVKEVYDLKDISRWCSKKTITDKVLKPKRTNEQKVLDAIGDKKIQEGDKIYVYFDEEDKLKLQENYNNDHSKKKLLLKLFKTMECFKQVLDIKDFPNLTLKKNKEKLQEVLDNKK